MKKKLITPLAFHLSTFTPGTRFRGARDRFKPLFLIALAVLAGDILYLLRLEAMYREDARSIKTPAVQTPYGATVKGQRDHQPILEF